MMLSLSIKRSFGEAEVCPLGEIFPVVVENLAAKVTAVKNVDAIVVVYSDIVWQVEFARSRCRARPMKR